MATLTFTGTLTHGSSTPEGAVPCREPFSFTVDYTEDSIKTVTVAASTVDGAVTLDTVSAPKFLLVQAVETDVTVKVSDGVTADPTPTQLTAGDGWIMIANTNGQPINALLITTPASPTTGARVRVLAVE